MATDFIYKTNCNPMPTKCAINMNGGTVIKLFIFLTSAIDGTSYLFTVPTG